MHIPKWQEISGCYSAVTTTNARELIKRVINSHGILHRSVRRLAAEKPRTCNPGAR
jgi:hypothetical protein